MENVENTGVEVKYDILLEKVHKHLIEKYSTITGFLNHDDFLSCGFEDTQKERTKVNSYLSMPKEGEKAVQSFPALKKIGENLMGMSLSSKITVTRTSQIFEN